MKDEEYESQETGEWPLWRIALRELMQLPSFGFGLVLDASWFESRLASPKDSTDFAFQMLELRGELEAKHGYYLQSQTIQDEESGLKKEVWQIPSAAAHEDVSRTFEEKLRRYGHRAVALRLKVLSNPSAKLSDAERLKMDGAARIAATRLVLIRREKTIARAVRKHFPKLLGEGE